MTRSWGDEIFGGFKSYSKKEITARRDANVMREVGYILDNHKITKRRLVLIIEASTKPKETP